MPSFTQPTQPLRRLHSVNMRPITCSIAGTLVIVLTGCSSGVPSSSPEPRSSAVASSASTEVMPENLLVLRPQGVGQLRLGMSHREVAATGLADAPLGSPESGWDNGCRVLVLQTDPLGGSPGGFFDGAVSPRWGLEAINATRLMAMPNGIRIGSTLADARHAFDRPGLSRGDHVTVRASERSDYVIQIRRVVSSIVLELRERDCAI